MKKTLSILLATVLLLTMIPLSVVSVSAATRGKTGDCTWTLNGTHLTISGKGAMEDYELYGDIIPAPWGTKVTKVTIKDGVTSIGNNAFLECANLTSITIPNSVTEIGGAAFFECSSLKTVTIPNSVTGIFSYAFYGCTSLTSVTIPDSVTGFGPGAFYGCTSLTEINIPYGVTFIWCDTFSGCTSLSSVTLPGSVKYIDNCAFVDCTALTSITIPNSVEYIGSRAFMRCTGLTAISLPNSVTEIKYATFDECSKLSDIYYSGSKKEKEAISVSSRNSCLKRVTWHYNTCKTHKYSNKCDKTCNKCDWTRTITHSYKVVSTKKATATANGYVQKKCSVCGSTTKTTLYKASTVKLSTTAYTYNGAVKKPTVTVKDSKGKAIASSNYTVTYASGRKNVGTYKVTIKFKGNYTGTKTLTFKILPAKTSISKLTAGSKKLTVKWAKKTTQVTGYEIQYSTSKSFSSYKTKTITKNSTLSTTLTGLSAKKTYYVRVRTYKTVSGKKVYSGWSTVKSLKTK